MVLEFWRWNAPFLPMTAPFLPVISRFLPVQNFHCAVFVELRQCFSTLRHSCGFAPDFLVGWECAQNFGHMSL